MKLYKEKFTNNWELHLTRRAFLHTINQWTQLRPGYNWRTFHLIHFMVEQDRMAPGWEAEFLVLGLGVRLRVNHDWEGTELYERLKDVESSLEVDESLAIESQNSDS